jgi:hypothetical protein
MFGLVSVVLISFVRRQAGNGQTCFFSVCERRDSYTPQCRFRIDFHSNHNYDRSFPGKHPGSSCAAHPERRGVFRTWLCSLHSFFCQLVSRIAVNFRQILKQLGQCSRIRPGMAFHFQDRLAKMISRSNTCHRYWGSPGSYWRATFFRLSSGMAGGLKPSAHFHSMHPDTLRTFEVAGRSNGHRSCFNAPTSWNPYRSFA